MSETQKISLFSKLRAFLTSNKYNLAFLVIFLLLAIFTRFYNLDESATFFWDPARDLMRIHQYYKQKQLTLIGPISEEGNRVFSSLTYYMLMPFAVVGNFDPVSTAYGAAFWGTLTAIIIFLLTVSINHKTIFLLAPLLVVWFPLIETSRWAWNPNLIFFWIALGLLFFEFKKSVWLFFSGLAMGLSIHHHFVALPAIGLFWLLVSIQFIKAKRVENFVCFSVGIVFSILPVGSRILKQSEKSLA